MLFYEIIQFLLLGERPFACSFCHKFFKTKAALKTHEMNHLGTTPQRFKCETCNKPFSLKAHYEVHKRTHTGEKPFSCHFCGKCFNYRGTWRVSLFLCLNSCNKKTVFFFLDSSTNTYWRNAVRMSCLRKSLSRQK